MHYQVISSTMLRSPWNTEIHEKNEVSGDDGDVLCKAAQGSFLFWKRAIYIVVPLSTYQEPWL